MNENIKDKHSITTDVVVVYYGKRHYWIKK